MEMDEKTQAVDVELVGEAEQFVQQLLQERKRLEAASSFLAVYKQAVVDYSVVQKKLVELRKEEQSWLVKLSEIQEKYAQERQLLDVELKKKRDESGKEMVRLNTAYKDVERDHKIAVDKMTELEKVMNTQFDEKMNELQRQLDSKVVELNNVREEYDKITTLLGKMRSVVE